MHLLPRLTFYTSTFHTFPSDDSHRVLIQTAGIAVEKHFHAFFHSLNRLLTCDPSDSCFIGAYAAEKWDGKMRAETSSQGGG